MCIAHKVPSRREVLRRAVLGIPALALGTLGTRFAFAASGEADTPGLKCSTARLIATHPTALRVGDVEITRIVETEGAMMTLSSSVCLNVLEPWPSALGAAYIYASI
jgi:hypothetical protein